MTNRIQLSVRSAISVMLEALILVFALAGTDASAAGKSRHKKEPVQAVENAGAKPVLWRDPVDISTRDVFYGPGGQKDQPPAKGAFTFVEEDLNGTNPKIVVQDEDGVKWTVKLGAEARPETVASRLTWAIGYFTNEDYFMHDLNVEGVPAHLHRGRKLIASDGTMHDVRLKRHLKDEKNIANWHWREDPFTGTRQLNGLRVMMALMNNWDATDQNNKVYAYKHEGDTGQTEQIYMVSDLGSTFGGGRLAWPMRKDRGNLRSYSRSKFITELTPATVDFFVPTRPSFFFLFKPRDFVQKSRIRWIGKRIPRRDAKWLGDQLGRLTPEQIRAAFRAAQYSPEEVEGFATVIENRITTLEDL